MNANHTPTINVLVRNGMRVIAEVTQEPLKPCSGCASIEFALVEPKGGEFVYATRRYPSLDDLEAHVAETHVGSGI